MINLLIKTLPHFEGLNIPAYATPMSAGIDLQAACAGSVVLQAAERAVIETGISIALPEGYEAQIRPRSGLAAKKGLTVLNSPGTIDADYRGEIKIILINHSSIEFTIERGMRIAQMVIAPITQVTFTQVEELSETIRGEGGFGSTGVKEEVTQ